MRVERTKILEELSLYLRPPGQGIYTVSTGKAELESFSQKYSPTYKEPLDFLTQIDWQTTKPFLLGIPSDTGAGFLKGAAHGPLAIREKFLAQKLDLDQFIDLGDVTCIPHLLHDSMLNEEQIKNSRQALYSSSDNNSPVSPLSITQRVTELLLELNPKLKLFSIGGDHSCSLPLVQTYLHKRNERTAILHIDAHTDLMEERLGVKYCFATWAYHIIKDLHSPSDLIQIGIRASAHNKEFWEQKYAIQQYRMKDLQSPKKFFTEFKNYLDTQKIKQIYISNDIDGTDLQYASLCGTPEKDGIEVEWLLELFSLIQKSDITVIASDFMEFAPKVKSEFAEQSIQTSFLYCQKHLELLKV